jgi:hypothetical protein
MMKSETSWAIAARRASAACGGGLEGGCLVCVWSGGHWPREKQERSRRHLAESEAGQHVLRSQVAEAAPVIGRLHCDAARAGGLGGRNATLDRPSPLWLDPLVKWVLSFLAGVQLPDLQPSCHHSPQSHCSQIGNHMHTQLGDLAQIDGIGTSQRLTCCLPTS